MKISVMIMMLLMFSLLVISCASSNGDDNSLATVSDGVIVDEESLAIENTNDSDFSENDQSSDSLDFLYQYDEYGELSEGSYAVRLGDYWGFVDENGNKIIEIQYSSVTPFEDGVSVVSVNTGTGVINKLGEYVIPLKRGVAIWLTDGLISYSEAGNMRVLDTEGNIVLEDCLVETEYSDNLYIMKMFPEYRDLEKLILTDKTGKQVLDISERVSQFMVDNDQVEQVRSHIISSVYNGWMDIMVAYVDIENYTRYWEHIYMNKNGEILGNRIFLGGNDEYDTNSGYVEFDWIGCEYWYKGFEDGYLLAHANLGTHELPAIHSFLYDTEGTLIYEADYFCDTYWGEYLISTSAQSQLITNILNEETYRFPIIHTWEGFDFAIVGDGIYYGLFTPRGMEYAMEYNTISIEEYPDEEDEYVSLKLEKGSVVENLLLDRNGNVVEI